MKEFRKEKSLMEWDDQKVLANVRRADTDDLLDRITAYRAGMEPDAVAMIERELHGRGVTANRIADHQQVCERDCIYLPDGTAAMCSLCRKPAVREGRGWWKIWWTVPIYPRRLRYCQEHCPR
jgi:hypothetical protein